MMRLLFLVLALGFNTTLFAQIYTTQVSSRGGNAHGIDTDTSGNLFFHEGARVLRFRPSIARLDTVFVAKTGLTGLALANRDSALFFTRADTVWSFRFSDRSIRPIWNGFEYPKIIRVQKKTGDIFAMEIGGDNGRAAAISRINPASGERTKIAGGRSNFPPENGYLNGAGDFALFNFPRPNGGGRLGCAIVFSLNEDTLFIGDLNNRCIRKLDIDARRVTTFAGPIPDSVRIGYRDGYRDFARFNQINGLEIDSAGNIYVADRGNFDNLPTNGNRVRKISPGGLVRTLAGNGRGQGMGTANNMDYIQNGIGTGALIGEMNQMVFSPNKDTLYIVLRQRIIKLRKRQTSLKLDTIPDLPLGYGNYPVSFTTNNVLPVELSLVESPVGISLANDSIDINIAGEEGNIVVKALQREDDDSTYTTFSTSNFSVFRTVETKLKTEFADRIRYYPVPAANNLTIQIQQAENQTLEIQLFNAQGKQMLVAALQLDNTGKAVVSTSNLQAGMYQMRVLYKNNIWSRKLLIVHE